MATLERFGEVPALVMSRDETPRPFLLWMHGRTANKELDPGRYLRFVRRGINVCAVDLPGHGERFAKSMQEAEGAFRIVQQMSAEIDGVMRSLRNNPSFDHRRAAIGGMSAGGMAVIGRLIHQHPFKAAILEATMGQWRSQRHHAMFNQLTDPQFNELNPADHLDNWQEIPLLAFHARHDQWVPYAAQNEFISRLKQKYATPDQIEFVTFDHTGAPKEHVGFGRESAFVKEIQVDFLARVLQAEMEKAV